MLTKDMRKTTSNVVSLVSNVILAFLVRCFSGIYKGPKIALSGVAKKEHSIPLAILRGGLIRAEINDVSGPPSYVLLIRSKRPLSGKA